MSKILLILLLMLSSCSSISNNTKLELGWQALNVADYYGTHEVLRAGGSELNPLIGEHPSDDRLITFCILSALLHYTLTNFIIPDKWKKYWYGYTYTLEIITVANHIQIIEKKKD